MTGKSALTELKGRVLVGNRVGATLGVPTANIAYALERAAMPDGVYVADIVLLDQEHKVYHGVLNQGNHPTVPRGQPAVEIHLFDFQGLLYGQRVLIRYWHFLRPETCFPNKELLRAQMQQDIQDAREWFRQNPDYLKA
ncbi:MAG: riboflavin kinase [Christensenellales bacterium]|jgi:riboflavin kinase/FMN adenylyltransferase